MKTKKIPGSPPGMGNLTNVILDTWPNTLKRDKEPGVKCVEGNFGVKLSHYRLLGARIKLRLKFWLKTISDIEGLALFQALINFTITGNSRIHRTSSRFVQWSDLRANIVYGLGFEDEDELCQVCCLPVQSFLWIKMDAAMLVQSKRVRIWTRSI